MVAGIDPEAEARLIGLDNATISGKHSRYFDKQDKANVVDPELGTVEMPILMSEREYVDASRTYTYEKIDLPLINDSIQETIQDVTKRGGAKFLNTLQTTDDPAKTYSVTTQDVQKTLLKQIMTDSFPSCRQEIPNG